MMKQVRPAAAGLLVALAATTPLASQEAQRLTISQARQVAARPAAVRLYLDVLDGSGRPLPRLDPQGLTATLGEESLTLRSLRPFAESGEGVAYVFLLDVSRSLTAEQFAAIRAALGFWFSGLHEADRAAILAFGDTSRTVADFTDDTEVLTAALASLGPTDDRTVLHRALLDALALTERQDPGLPGRRAVVVLSDGRDEGSGLAVEDVLARLAEVPTPMYAIGSSRLPGESRQRYLEVLHRLASNSGGAFYEADRTSFAASYEAIREAIRRVQTAELVCPTCQPDGRLRRLQVRLRQGARVLTHGIDLRLLPDPSLTASPPPEAAPPRAATESQHEPRPPAPRPEPAPEEPAPAAEPPSPQNLPPATAVPGESGVVEPPEAPALPPDEDGGRGSFRGLLVSFFVLLGLAAAILIALRRRRAMAPGVLLAGEAGDTPRQASEPKGPPPTAPSSKAAAPLPAPMSPTTRTSSTVGPRLRLVVVRGSERGREYSVAPGERTLVGSDPDCDCVLAREPGVAPLQFELLHREGEWRIRNLAEASPTLLDGHPVEGTRALRSGDLVGGRETIFRVVIGS